MEEYLTQITNYLLTQSWQIAVLVVAIAAVSLVLKNKSAHVRYLLWLIVLAKCLVPPLISVPLAILPEEQPVVMPPTVNATGYEPVISRSALVATPPAPAHASIRPRKIELTTRQWLGLAWIAGVGIFALAALIKALRTHLWLKRERKPLSTERRADIAGLLSGLGIKTPPKVWLIDGIGQPFVWGLLRGSIYLPSDFVRIDSSEHCRDVLGHELSHVLRFDAGVNLLQIVAQAIFWFHPFVWWANRKIRAEREKCCDEMAIARLGAKVKDYSIAIVNALITEHESTRPVPSLAVAGPVKNIEERIKTMMRPGKKFYKRPSLRAVIVLLLVALFTVPIGCALIRRARTETATERAEKRYASLYEAAKAGDLVEVKRLIAKAADVNAFDKEDGLTPLGVAAVECHIEIVKVLLDSGANVDVADTVGYSPIYYAVLNYDKETVEETIRALISGGADVNLTQDKDDTPLLTAIWGDQTDIVKTLLDAGANAKLKDDKGISPLQQAVDGGNPGIVTLLVDTDDTVPDLHRASLKGDLSKLKELLVEGADINAKDGYQLTPLDYALAAGQSNAAKFLLNQGADINIYKTPGYRNDSLLHRATRAGLLEMVQILIEKGIPVDINHFGTALHVAASYGHKEIAEFLISKGAALDSKGQGNKSTPLHVAASIGDTDIVELLISNGADINASNYSGRTPLDVAIDVARQRSHTKHTKIVDVLRQHGAKETLYGAFILGDTNELKSLISQGADINIEWPIPGGMTLLHHVAAEKGYKDIAKLLIDKGADVNAQNRVNVTPLHLGVENCNKDVVELLIANGADVNAKRNTRIRNASTALHDAVDASRGDIVELLIAHGADVNARTDLGITPLYIAEQNGYTEIVGLLLKHGAKEISPSLFGAYAYGDIEQIQALLSQGADVNAKNNSGHTLLHLACQTGNKEVAELLIDKGTDINAKTNSGSTPLHYAVQFGHKDIVELLIAKGADLNAENKEGRTPLDLAEEKGHTEIVELLRKHGEKSEQTRFAARTFNSKVAFDVWVEETCSTGGEQVGRTPSATPLEIPACWLWGVKPLAPVNDWDVLVREISQNEVPGLRLDAADSDLKQLAGLAKLRSLNLSNRMNSKITDAGLEHIKGMTGLQNLNLLGTKITDAGLEHIKGMTGLQRLDLTATKITDAGLEHLKGMTNLRGLDLTATKITDAGLEHLKGMTNLRGLDLTATKITDAGLEHLKGMTNLRGLDLTNTKITDFGLEYLKGMSQLEELTLPSSTSLTGTGLEHINGLTGLKRLYLGRNTTDAGLEHLKGLTGLETLWLSYTSITDAGLKHLKGLTGLKRLDLVDTKITDAGLEHLKGLTGLETLYLWDTLITDAGMEHLTALTGLQILELRDTKITDKGLEHLKSMTGLQSLGLPSTATTDMGLEHIKGLTGLKWLCLDGPSITDKGLEYLKDMTALKILIVDFTNVTDEGLEHLKGMTSLQYLRLLRSTKITDAGLEQLKQSLPNLKILTK